MTLVLASASPRRSELLDAAGFRFVVDPVHIDESVTPGETPTDHVRRLAREKAAAGAARHPGSTVVGADTVVVIDDHILGKPGGNEVAREMLERLSGRVHQVFTGVAVATPSGIRDAVEVSSVWMAPLSSAEIEEYIASGEPLDKAGAYAIQGLASRFIDRIDGSYSNIVGLPVAVVYRLVRGC